ncbi:MAG: glycine zipper domain-containing protein [Candidatus Omnitrophica bacterium]|nr:glycine zipper domain-containing protein [Candidatus Omnitrophota bacterium]
MKKTGVVLLGITVLFAGAGCQSSPNRTGEGALLGGLLGAGAGTIIGNQSHDRDRGRGQGAIIGGVVGALGGALAGSQIQKQPQQQAQATNPNQMAMQQIVDMSKQGVNEDVIVDRLRMSNSRFSLTPSDVDYLRSQGVTQKVISAMQGY